MTSQILWHLLWVFSLICFLFLSTLCTSFFIYKITKGRSYQDFKKQPKRFLIGSLVTGFVFGILSMIPDLTRILLSPIMIEPINIYHSSIFAVIGFFMLVVIGSPIVWLSYKLAIPLAHKIFHYRL